MSWGMPLRMCKLPASLLPFLSPLLLLSSTRPRETIRVSRLPSTIFDRAKHLLSSIPNPTLPYPTPLTHPPKIADGASTKKANCEPCGAAQAILVSGSSAAI